jgi:hypothetical protein
MRMTRGTPSLTLLAVSSVQLLTVNITERVGDDMPYVNKKRPYKHEWEMQHQRDEKPSRAARERARYTMDKKGIDRKGKDIDHVIPLSKGGTNAPSNLKLKKPSENRSYSRNSDHTVKVNKPKKK